MLFGAKAKRMHAPNNIEMLFGSKAEPTCYRRVVALKLHYADINKYGKGLCDK